MGPKTLPDTEILALKQMFTASLTHENNSIIVLTWVDT